MDYSEIFKKLEPYKDRFYFTPISNIEILELEKSLGFIVPAPFKSFLLAIGLKQDLVFGLYDNIDAIKTQYYDLSDDIKTEYFPIGDYGGEEEMLLKKDSADLNIYHFEYGHFGDIVEMGFTLEEHIINNIHNYIHSYQERALNIEKKKCVQFVIHTVDYNDILKVLNARLEEDWTSPEISPANVYTYSSVMQYRGELYSLRKSTYVDWELPLFAFDMRIPLLDLETNLLIDDTETIIKQNFEKYAVVNYGILPTYKRPKAH